MARQLPTIHVVCLTPRKRQRQNVAAFNDSNQFLALDQAVLVVELGLLLREDDRAEVGLGR